MTLFGTDGIRGKYGDFPLDNATIRKIGHAISKSFDDDRIKKILIAHDGRESCESIFRHLTEGILSHRDYEIVYLDLLPTPALSCILDVKTGLDSIGIQITASHNPYTDNGIKIFDRLGSKISSYQEKEIERIVDSKFEISDDIKLKFIHNNLYREKYISSLSELMSTVTKPSHKLNIAVDCANGAVSEVVSAINWPDNISLTIFNNSPNGLNINDKCGAVHPEYLSNVISESNKKNKSDYINFGICFDGDGDRAIIIDSSGNILDGDDLLYIFASNLKVDTYKRMIGNNVFPEASDKEKTLNDYFGRSEQIKVVGTVMTNFGIRKNLEKHNIRFLETDVGDKNVLYSLKENGAYIGAESSGHIIHRTSEENSMPIGDGIVTMIKFIHLLFDLNKNISEIYPFSLKVPSKLINIDTEEDTSKVKFKQKHHIILTKVEKMLKNSGRILVRKSGTQPLIRVLIEHESSQILNDAEKLIRSIQ